VESSCTHHFLEQKKIQLQKLPALKDHHQTTMTLKAIQWSDKYVLNLSEHGLTGSENPRLKRGLNFALTDSV
jgi:hypothetical protein